MIWYLVGQILLNINPTPKSSWANQNELNRLKNKEKSKLGKRMTVDLGGVVEDEYDPYMLIEILKDLIKILFF